VLERVKQERRLTWMILAQNAELLEVRADTVTLGFANSGARDSFMAGSSGGVLAGALAAVTGAQWTISPILTGGNAGGPAGARPQTNGEAALGQRQAAAGPVAVVPVAEGPERLGSQTVYAEDDTASAPLDEQASDDDEDVDEVSAAALLTEALGAELISEEDLDV